MIESFKVPRPEPITQRRIAHILGTLDDKIELNRRMNRTLERMARALFGESLFTSPTLGAALLGAARQLDPENAGQRDIIHTFALLGDPALKLPWGQTSP